MRKSVQVVSWAVYQATILGEPGPNVVCDQAEWDAIEQAQPGLHRLIKGGIRNEGEAERLARGTSGDSTRPHPKKSIFALLALVPERVVADDGDRRAEWPEDDGPILLPFSALPKEIDDLAVTGGPQDERTECA